MDVLLALNGCAAGHRSRREMPVHTSNVHGWDACKASGQQGLCAAAAQVLEPRRVAAKSAARRMAALLGEPVGRTVGYRVKLDTRVRARASAANSTGCPFQAWQLLDCTYGQCCCDTVAWDTGWSSQWHCPSQLGGDEPLSCRLNTAQQPLLSVC